MGQFKVYGRRSEWLDRREALSDHLHAALVNAWHYPPEKRFQRFLWLEDDDLVAPGRGPGYLVIELVAFSGRSPEAKRELVRQVYDRVCGAFDLPVDDLELVILESPRSSWGIRGMGGDELTLGYEVDV
ncbi:tautomerase family protein [Sanguibacter suarezii]|uniref:tautomerase family protein n=1 Tax=Sanguibacter suarezii TaxID=60921 RepID=UPI0008298034|nr:tautomerase family protein [Sanguibacter suarezii]